MQGHVSKWGNSLALRLPKPIAEALNVSEGEAVDLRVEEDRLIITPVGPVYSLDELLSGVTEENQPESFDDSRQGKELI